MRLRQPVLLFCCLLAGSLVVAAEGPKPEMRFYDVSDLTVTAVDHPGPAIGHVERPAPAANGPFVAAPVAVPTVQGIADMIRNRIHPDSWDPNLGTSIEERGGQLIVMQMPAMHLEIEQLLSKFRADRQPQVNIQALLVDLDTAVVLPFLGKAGKSFSQEQVLGALKQGKLAGAPQLTLQNAQRSHVLSGRLHSYIADYHAGGGLSLPVIGRLLEGTLLDAQVMLHDGGQRAAIELRLNMGANAQLDAGAEPRAGKDTGALPLHRASTEDRALRMTVESRIGAWTLAATLPAAADAEGKAARSTLVFVQVNKVE